MLKTISCEADSHYREIWETGCEIHQIVSEPKINSILSSTYTHFLKVLANYMIQYGSSCDLSNFDRDVFRNAMLSPGLSYISNEIRNREHINPSFHHLYNLLEKTDNLLLTVFHRYPEKKSIDHYSNLDTPAVSEFQETPKTTPSS